MLQLICIAFKLFHQLAINIFLMVFFLIRKFADNDYSVHICLNVYVEMCVFYFVQLYSLVPVKNLHLLRHFLLEKRRVITALSSRFE